MKYIVSLSGGLASAACAIVAHEANLDYEMVFADTLIEDPDLYRFINELSEKLNKPIVWLKDGRDVWQVYVDRKYIGNTRIAHCSRDLKTAQVKTWMNANCNFEDTLVLGMSLDEEDRLETAFQNWFPYNVKSFLIRGGRKFGGPLWKSLSTEDIEKLVCEKYGVKKPSLYSHGFTHNNCGGFCCRAGQGQFATLLEVFPQRYNWHEERQEWAMAKIGSTAKPFLRVTIKGNLEYLTMKQFREHVQSGELKPKMYEKAGCGCFVDDGPIKDIGI